MKRGALGRGTAGFVLAAVALCGGARADAASLAPVLPGLYAAGQGVDATFLKVDDAWRGSGVRYDPATDQFGSGVPIGNFAGGTGLWGLIDWRSANFAPAPGMIEEAWSGRVAEIAFGDAMYDSLYAATLGTMALPPLFSAAATTSQDNWTARFTGYIRITEAGAYNFGILHDDGFTFTLGGAGGQSLSLSHDYLNPNSRMAFDQDVRLDVGLYSFELGAYERLEVGVVELGWSQDQGDWSRLPADHLLAAEDVQPVPAPPTLALLACGLGALAGTRRQALNRQQAHGLDGCVRRERRC